MSTDYFRNISVKGLGSAAKSAAKGATADLKDAATEQFEETKERAKDMAMEFAED